MEDTLAPGLTHAAEMTVSEAMLVPGLGAAVGAGLETFADMPPVMATAMLVAFVEATCLDLVRPHLAPGQHSVGIHVDLVHTAPTLAGTAVRAEVELVEVDGRKLTFAVQVADTFGPVGEGRHRRAVIDMARFAEKAAARGE